MFLQFLGHNPHDKFVKTIFGKRDNLKDLLQQTLPETIYQDLDPESLTLDPVSYLDAKGRECFSDISAWATIRKKRHRIYILVEHKSYQDSLVHLQIYYYLYQIWKKDIKDQGGSELCPILPILFYHGPEKEIDPSFQSLLPPDLDNRYRLHQPEFQMIEAYIYAASPLTREEIQEKIEREVTDPVLKEVFISTAQLLVQEGMEKGLQEGRQEGRQEEIRLAVPRLQKRGISFSEIAEIFDVPEAELQKIIGQPE